MSTVDRLSLLLAQLRSSLLEKSRRGHAPTRSRPRSTGGASTPQSRPADNVRAGILSHLAGADLSQAASLHQARKIFIELVLVSEFGARIANDPRFTQIAEQVEAAMAEDEPLSDELDAILRELTENSSP